MTATQINRLAILGLLMLNLLLLAFLVFSPSRNAPPKPPLLREEVKHILHMDEQQHADFLELSKQHHQQMLRISQQQQEIVRPYFYQLYQKETQVASDSLLDELKQLEAQKIETTYAHFQDVKSMLNEDQLPYFEEYMHKALGRILNSTHPPHPPHPPKH